MIFKPTEDEDLSPADEVKIIYCSRTHSQLVQFVTELRRVDLPAPSWFDDQDTTMHGQFDAPPEVKHLSLGSRKNLCINSQVQKGGNVASINERCLELQQSDTPRDRRCSFLPSRENEPLVHEFRDHALAKVRDIEELGDIGRSLGICPYYASRTAIKPSEVCLDHISEKHDAQLL